MYETRLNNLYNVGYISSFVSGTVNVKIHWALFGAYVMTDIPSKQWTPKITAIVKILKKVHLYKL